MKPQKYKILAKHFLYTRHNKLTAFLKEKRFNALKELAYNHDLLIGAWGSPSKPSTDSGDMRGVAMKKTQCE